MQAYRNYHSSWSRLTRTVRVLIIINVIAYLVFPLRRGVPLTEFEQLLVLSGAGIRNWYLWQFVTYMFLHFGFFHLLINIVVLFFLGPELERELGAKKFLTLYFLSGILGGLGWILIGSAGVCVGASGAIFGVLGAFAVLHPQQPLTLLLFYILPITMKAWKLVVGFVLLELIMLFGFAGGRIANAVHLGGGFVGALYTAIFVKRSLFSRKSRAHRHLRLISNKNDVDDILDKIAVSGVTSLTKSERKTLNRASSGLRGKR